MRKLLVVLTVALLTFAGCGGDDGGDAETGDAAGTSQADTDFSGSGSGDFCSLAKKYTEDFEDVGSDGGEDIEAEFEELTAAIDDLAEEAPGEIKEDVGVVNEAFKRSTAIFEKYDYDFTKIPEEEAQSASLDSPEIEAASRRVESYFEKVCKLDTDDDGDTDGVIDDGSTSDSTTEDEQAPDESVDEPTEDTTGGE